MATTENIKIVFSAEDKELQGTIDKLIQLGKISEEDAKKLIELGNASKSANASLSDTEKKVAALNDKLKESEAKLDAVKKKYGENSAEAKKAAQAVENLRDSLQDTLKSTKDSENSFVSLKTRLKEARDEVQRLSQEFGESSSQVLAAKERAGELADEYDDLNRQIKLLNPESRIQAFTNLGQGIVGAFQVATGALQAFGAENEEVQKIAQRLQGALNVAQGVQSIFQLKEAYQDLKVVLGLTATAQKGLAVANEVEAASAQTAAVANRSLAASLGPIVLIVGALAAAYLLLAKNQDDSKKKVDEALKAFEELRKEQELAVQIAEAQGKSELEILELRKANNKLYQDTLSSILAINKDEKVREEIQTNINDLKREERLLSAQSEQATKKATEAELERLKKIREEIAKNQAALKAQFDEEFNKQMAENDKDLALRRAVNAIQFFNKNKELRDADLVAEINASEQRLETLKLFGKEGTKEYQLELAKRNLLYKKYEQNQTNDAIEAEKERARIAKELYEESVDFILTLQAASFQREAEELQIQKEKGLITEEQYQEKLKSLKIKQARADKEIAIFNATVLFAQALLNALTFKPANAVPAALVATAAIAGLNLAKVIATPLPKFKEGTLNFQGGSIDGDGGALAILHPNEAVIPADRNRAYHPTLEAIYKKQIKPSELNAFVLNKLAGKGSIGRDTQITASVDTYALSRAMSRNKGVEVTLSLIHI